MFYVQYTLPNTKYSLLFYRETKIVFFFSTNISGMGSSESQCLWINESVDKGLERSIDKNIFIPTKDEEWIDFLAVEGALIYLVFRLNAY